MMMKEGVKIMLTIKDFYKMSSTADEPFPLLTDFTSAQSEDWWKEYKEDFEVFDYQFMKQFKSFIYFDQDANNTDEENLEDFMMTVYSWLAMNDKRYYELWRIHNITDDEAYALTNNYDIHETYTGTNTTASSAITGQRTDVTIDQVGEQEMSNLNKVTGYNSSSENTNDSSNSATGSREDTHQFTKGQEQDTARTQGNDGHTLRRYGNLGVMTVDDILTKHSTLWSNFNFYQMVFDDICKNFLLIGR